jgi:gamma-glutamylcyclotransferase (GGCT)/AIG2-like uncharacterized protein YtfP
VLLFAYGTLMRGEPLHRVLRDRARYLEPAHTRGRLLDLGRYPGLVDGAGTVRGELYGFDDPELLPVVDREEGYNFVRRTTTVTRANGRRVRAWVYRYTGPRDTVTPIPDGDWRTRAAGPSAVHADRRRHGRRS